MVLILVRHTTPAVDKGVCYGRTDLDVAETFNDEAAQVFDALPDFSRIVTSPLQRCAKLAAYIGERKGVEPQADPRLMEMDFGTWEGRLWSEIPKDELDGWAKDFLHARPHGGESVNMLQERTGEAIREIDHSKGPVLVVTHLGVMKAALSSGVTADDFATNIPFGGIAQINAEESASHD
ncbi:MAG: alpha-ribazole phosphatase [Pseudomonadota bacterium]